MDILVTRRLTLRPPLEVDIDDIATHLGNWNVARMLGRVPFPYDRQDAADWVAKQDGSDDLVFTIHRERLIGVVGIEGGPEHPRLGYWLAESWWGRGFMSEAVGAVLGYAFDRWPDARVRAAVAADNPVSLKLQQKLGFQVTGSDNSFLQPRQEMATVIRTELIRTDFAGSNAAVFDVAA